MTNDKCSRFCGIPPRFYFGAGQMTNECPMTKDKLKIWILSLIWILSFGFCHSGFSAIAGRQVIRLTNRGQALVELAVFGAIFLMILSAILTYGLRFDYQQRAQMLSFRRALKIASDPSRGSGSYMMMADKPMPDPSSTFSVGATTPVNAGASVSARTNKMDASAADAAGLPTTVMDMQTSQANGVVAPPTRIVYKNAGFRIEYNVPADAQNGKLKDSKEMGKYKFIFSHVTALSTGGDWVATDDDSVAKTCTATINVVFFPVCTAYTINQIRIEDSCAGEMVDKSGCESQAMLLVDTQACVQQCRKSTSMDTNNTDGCDCACMCDKKTNPPNQDTNVYDPAKGGAWYAANYTKSGASYTFPVLEQMFSGTPTGTMGLDAGTSTIQAERQESVRKIETTGSIVTQESAGWRDATSKTMTLNHNLDANGFEHTYSTPEEFATHVENQTIDSEVTGELNQVLTTEK